MTSPDTEEALLQSACDLLRQDWVESFLFPTDKPTFARQLHHALSQQRAITASVHFGTQSPSVGPCQSLPGVDKKLSVLCVPSFSTGSITVGFEITECLSDSSPHPLGIPKYIGRYVRDDDEGLMLIIAEHPHLGVTEVTCCTLLSAGCRSQVYAVMNLRKLRAIVSSVHEKGYDKTTMQQATIFAYSSVDMRACPNCGCNTVLLCSCRLRTKRKAHPMDHDAESQNLSTFTGDFGGLARVRVIKNGKESVASFISQVQAKFTGSRENRRTLSSWAMTHTFETETLRVGNYRMPGKPLLIEEASDATTAGEDSCTSRTFGRGTGPAEKRKRDVVKDLPIRSRYRRISEGSVMSTASVGGVNSALDDALFMASKALAGDGSICPPAQESITSVTANQLPVSLASDGISLSQSAQRPLSSVKPPLPTIQRESLPSRHCPERNLASNEQISNHIQSMPVTQPQVAISTQQGQPGRQIIQPMQQLPGVVLVPMQPVYQPILANGVPLAPALAPISATRVYRDTRSKDEIRKARNRASAQRSNEKKKREVAQLKDDLEASVRRKEMLVERERALRRENAVLKAALGDSGVTAQ